MKQTNRNAQYQTNNSIACKIVKLSNYQLSRIGFMDDDNADIHLLSADNGDAKNRWDPPTPLAPRQRTGRVRGHLQASPPRCRIATADNPTSLGTVLAATKPTLGPNRTRAAKVVGPDRHRRTPNNNHHGTPGEWAVDSLAAPPSHPTTHTSQRCRYHRLRAAHFY